MRPPDAKPNADGSWTVHGRRLHWPARLGKVPLGYDPGRRGTPRVPGFYYAQNRDRTHLVEHAKSERERTLCGKGARYFFYPHEGGPVLAASLRHVRAHLEEKDLMNQEKINTLTEGLAKALALVDTVGAAAQQELGYDRTRRASARAVGQIEALLTALQEDWARDERELDEDIENFQKGATT